MSEKNIQCLYCDEVFSNESDIIKHVDSIHKDRADNLEKKSKDMADNLEKKSESDGQGQIETIKIVELVENDKDKDENIICKKPISEFESKNYKLNEIKALEKKLKNAMDKNITVRETNYGGSISVDMKTSLFEAVRNQILDNLNSKSEIISTQLTRTVQSNTDTNKKAAVEFHIDVVFKTLDSEEKVKMKVFTTNNSFQIQGSGLKKAYLNTEYPAKHFAKTYIIPFGEKILRKKPDIDNQYLPKLKKELLQLKQERFKKSTTQCVSLNCKHKRTINIKKH